MLFYRGLYSPGSQTKMHHIRQAILKTHQLVKRVEGMHQRMQHNQMLPVHQEEIG